MSPVAIITIGVGAVLLIGASLWLWRYWDQVAGVTPEEQAFDKRIARLNERQANRISDEELSRPISKEDGWSEMVARGRRAARQRDRYGGSLARRARERRR